MAIPRGQLICPKLANIKIAARFVATFTNFVAADACKKSKAKNRTKPKSKKLPVPGPKKPLQGFHSAVATVPDSLCDTDLQSSYFAAHLLPVNGFPVVAVGGGRTSQSYDCRHLLSLPRKILQTISQWSTDIGRGLPFGSGNVSTRIHLITRRHSLLPASYSRTSNSVPCGFTSSNESERKYGVSTFHVSDD